MPEPTRLHQRRSRPGTDPGLAIGVSLFACDHGTSGIGRYMIQMVEQMLRSGPQHRYHVWLATEDLPVFAFLSREWAAEVTVHAVHDRWNRPAASLVWHAATLPRLAAREGVDVLYLPAGNRRLVPFARRPRVAVVHDLSSFHVRGKYDPMRMLYIRRVLPWLIRRTDRVITISSSSANDITTRAGYPEDRLTLIGLGYDREMFAARDPKECLRKVRSECPGVPAEFVFYVSRLEHPGKNHVGLLRAYRRLLDEDPGFPHDLVFAGGRWNGAEAVDRAVVELGLGERVHCLGFVPGGLLPSLYGAARALVFPSLFEGFGLPVIEAQASGLPVAAAEISSLPEVAGDAALMFDPHDLDEMASAVRRIATEEPLRERLRQAGFANAARYTWERAAEATLEVLGEAARDR